MRNFSSQNIHFPQSLRIGAIAMALALVAVVGTGASAFAAYAALTGTVNCTGTTTEYATSRWNTQADVSLKLTKAAGSPRGGYAMAIGVYIPRLGVRDSQLFAGAPSTMNLMTGFRKGTEFKMRASMTRSAGACSNSWAGDLNF